MRGVLSFSEARADGDAISGLARHDRVLDVALPSDGAAEPLHLALAHQRVDGLHLDLEQGLDGRLDLGLGRVAGDTEDDLIVLRCQSRLLGDHGRADDVVMPRVAHASLPLALAAPAASSGTVAAGEATAAGESVAAGAIGSDACSGSPDSSALANRAPSASTAARVSTSV